MAKLDNNIAEKILRIVKPYHQQDEYELNYVIVDNEITFFASINESEQIPEEADLILACRNCSDVTRLDFPYKHKTILNDVISVSSNK